MPKDIELQIATQLVDDILAAGYAISVQDGEEDTLIGSSSKDEILKALQTTDEVDIRIMDGDLGIGSILLVWGKGVDVIEDYDGPDELMTGLMEGAQNAADKAQ